MITSSIIVKQTAQKDGTVSVHERHTDQIGKTYEIIYFAVPGTDLNAMLVQHATKLNSELRDIDLGKALESSDWNFKLNYATDSDLATFARQKYSESITDDTDRIGKRIDEWITKGRFTDTDMKNAFGMTTADWSKMKGDIQSLIPHYDAIQGAKGK